MRNILLDLEYDGTDFCGSQVQSRGRTVQGELERALCRLTQQETRVILAGRTDAGVHASGQRASFRTSCELPLPTLQRALNALLPPDLAVVRAQEVPESFHARFSARRRTYRYTVYNASVRSPLARRYAWHVAEPLDVAPMAQVARTLVGEHDFASFASAGSGMGPRGTVRTVYRAECWREGPWVYFEITADAFLRGMVRSLMGQLCWVGLGRCSTSEFEAVWASRDRARLAPPAPAHGLCLVRVEYDGVA
ncbi:MAG: tRNA pseudouridine(38-40) synthase TruA [Chloroflexia bacterium]